MYFIAEIVPFQVLSGPAKNAEVAVVITNVAALTEGGGEGNNALLVDEIASSAEGANRYWRLVSTHVLLSCVQALNAADCCLFVANYHTG